MSYNRKNNLLPDVSQWLPKTGQSSFGSQNLSDVDKLNKQIGNYDKRLGAVGIDGQKETDKRNWFEKLTNLPEEQSFFLDIFELLNRPQEAITGMFQEMTRNDDVPLDATGMTTQEYRQAVREREASKGMTTGQKALQGLSKGISGEKNYYYGQVLRNIFQDGKQEDGKIDWTDGLGLMLDMTLDPMSLALGGANKAGKLAKGADTVADVGKSVDMADKTLDAGKALKLADVATDASKAVDTANDIAKSVSKISETKKYATGVPQFLTDFGKKLTQAEEVGNVMTFAETWDNVGGLGKAKLLGGKVLNPIAEATDINRYLFSENWNKTHNTLNQALFGKVFDLGKAGAKGVGNLAESGFNKYIDALETTNPERAKELSNSFNDTVADIKHLFSKPTKDAKLTSFLANQNKRDLDVRFQKLSEELYESVFNNMDELTKMGFKNEEEVTRAVAQLIESTASKELVPLSDFISSRYFGYGLEEFIPATPEFLESISEAFPGKTLKELGITQTGDALKLDSKVWGKFGDGTVGKLADEQALERLQKNLISASTYQDKEPLIRMGSLLDKDENFLRYKSLYDNNEDFRALTDNFQNTLNTMRDEFGLATFGEGHNLNELTKKGYLPRNLSDDALEFIETLNPEAKPVLGFEPDFDKWVDPDNPGGSFRGQAGSPSYKELKGRTIEGLTTYDADKAVVSGYRNFFDDEDWVAKRVAESGQEAVDKAREIINREGIEWYSQDAFKSVIDYATNKTDAMVDVNKKVDILLDSTFSKQKNTYDGLAFVEPGGKIPRKNYDLLSARDSENILRDLKRAKDWGGKGENLDKLIESFEKTITKDGMVYISKDIAPFVKTVSRNTGDTLLNKLNEFNNLFKSGKVMSPSFHFNNNFGNATNQIIGGMPVDAILDYNAKTEAFKKQLGDVGDGLILDKGLQGLPLTPREQELFDHAKILREGGIFTPEYKRDLFGLLDDEAIGLNKTTGSIPNTITDTGHKVPDHRKGGKIKQTFNKIGEVNMNINQKTDDAYRIATYLYAVDNPEFVANLGVKTPLQASKLLHYDPTDLTLLEDKVLKKIIPFYTFQRMNLGLQMKNIVNNPDKYRDMIRLNKSLWGSLGIDPEDRRPFEINNQYMPSLGTLLKGVDKDEVDEDGFKGGYTSLKTSGGYSEFGDMLTDPLGWLASSTTPVFRYPFEKATGNQAFTGQPISNYKGEKSTRFPIMTKEMEHLLSQTGLDVPARSVQGLFDMLGGDISGGAHKALNVTQKGSVEQAEKQKAYAQLQAYEELVKRLKAKGVEVPTLAELKKMGYFE